MLCLRWGGVPQVLDEWRPRFQGARGVLRDRRRRLDAVDPLVLPFPPGQGGPRQGAWVAAWNAFIAYEKSNPQVGVGAAAERWGGGRLGDSWGGAGGGRRSGR